MTTAFPQRPRSHQLADESANFFVRHLPQGWICDRPQNDYGVDLRVGLAENGQVNGQTLVVQLKASASAELGESLRVKLEVATLNYLRNMLEVALLVKYVAEEQEAYWLLLKDVLAVPRNGQHSLTIKIPRGNRLSQNPWRVIANHVALVHHRKLHANVRNG